MAFSVKTLSRLYHICTGGFTCVWEIYSCNVFINCLFCEMILQFLNENSRKNPIKMQVVNFITHCKDGFVYFWIFFIYTSIYILWNKSGVEYEHANTKIYGCTGNRKLALHPLSLTVVTWKSNSLLDVLLISFLAFWYHIFSFTF